MIESDADRRTLATRLAAELAEESGLRTARLMQRLGTLAEKPGAAPGAKASDGPPSPTADAIAAAMIEHFLGDEPRPIGIWQPVAGSEPQRFERNDGAENAHWWAPQPTLEAKSALLPLRVALIGESTATGWLCAPELTPALLLDAFLRRQSPGTFDVVDLSVVNLQMEQMLELACASLQLHPDLLVVYAGNNWSMRLPSHPDATLDEMHSAATAFRRDGIAGLRDVADAATRTGVEQTLDVLGSLALREGVPIVLVIPDVNLADWSRSRPVAWLDGNDVDRWHELDHRAGAALDEGESGVALALADDMYALDAGTCAASHYLRGRALAALGRATEAAEAWRQCVDARAWDNVPTVPSVTSVVRDVMLEKAEAHGFDLVDLRTTFDDAALARDRTLFFDYCHHTPAGMRAAMAAVANAVVDIALQGSETLPAIGPHESPSLPAQSPMNEAATAFLTALYVLHYDGDAATDRLDEDHLAVYWIERARKMGSPVDGWIEDYIWSRTAPRAATGVSAAMGRFVKALTDLQAQLANDDGCDAELVEALIERIGLEPAPFVEALVDGRAPGQGPIDLLDQVTDRSTHARFAGHAGFGHQGNVFHRAQWPISSFVLVADGRRPLQLKIVWRLCDFAGPYQGLAELRLNGEPVHRAELGCSWQRLVLTLEPPALVRGYNRLDVDWPPLGDRAAAARRRIADDLDLGRATDLHPVFGEIHVLESR